jgi:hypothetical protein
MISISCLYLQETSTENRISRQLRDKHRKTRYLAVYERSTRGMRSRTRESNRIPFAARPKAWVSRPLACWDYGFESPRRHGCMSLVRVVCCQVEVSATGWSLVQRSVTECGVSECDREASIMRRLWPTRGCCATGNKFKEQCKRRTGGVLVVTHIGVWHPIVFSNIKPKVGLFLHLVNTTLLKNNLFCLK